jgi:hypothetical protein
MASDTSERATVDPDGTTIHPAEEKRRRGNRVIG